jgi:CBS domain-containing protein
MDTMQVKDHMTRTLVTLRPDMDIMEAVTVLCEKNMSGAPVVDQLGNFIGILVEKDCLNAALNAAYFEEQGGRVDSFMHRNVEVIDTEDNITDVAKRLIDTGYRGMPVIDENNNLVGMINRSDILKVLIKYQ